MHNDKQLVYIIKALQKSVYLGRTHHNPDAGVSGTRMLAVSDDSVNWVGKEVRWEGPTNEGSVNVSGVCHVCVMPVSGNLFELKGKDVGSVGVRGQALDVGLGPVLGA